MHVVHLNVLYRGRVDGSLDHVTALQQPRLPTARIERVAEDDRVALAAVDMLDDTRRQQLARPRIARQQRGWEVALDTRAGPSAEPQSVRPQPCQARLGLSNKPAQP